MLSLRSWRTRRALVAVGLAAALSACGSSDATPGTEGSGGGAGSGSPAGTGGDAGSSSQADGSAGSGSETGGTAGATGQDSGACPASAPKIGSACSPGAFCSYGGGICCGGGYRCGANGTWEIIAAGCACFPPPDAGNSTDASSHADAGSCAQETTVEGCDARTDCHSVFIDPHDCRCAALGCCAHFQRCADGKKANCTGPVACTIASIFCEGPYVVSYTNACYEGCVRATECGP
jgi:hypothetical protein